MRLEERCPDRVFFVANRVFEVRSLCRGPGIESIKGPLGRLGCRERHKTSRFPFV